MPLLCVARLPSLQRITCDSVARESCCVVVVVAAPRVGRVCMARTSPLTLCTQDNILLVGVGPQPATFEKSENAVYDLRTYSLKVCLSTSSLCALLTSAKCTPACSGAHARSLAVPLELLLVEQALTRDDPRAKEAWPVCRRVCHRRRPHAHRRESSCCVCALWPTLRCC